MNKTELLWMFDRWLIQFECDVEAHFGAGNDDLAVRAFCKWHRDVAAAIADIDLRMARGFLKTGRAFSFGDGTKKDYTPRAQFMKKCGGPAKRCLLRLKQQVIDGELGLPMQQGRPVARGESNTASGWVRISVAGS